LKYYILKVDPKKENPFNPEESVDCREYGPFIQYTYARIQSIIRKANFDFRESGMISPSFKRERIIETIRIIS
jgi:arginyl-tRNA synthetase